MFSIFSTAQKLPKIFTDFFGKCKNFHKKYEEINGKHFNLIYGSKGGKTKNRLFSVFPATESNINGKNLLVSHPGSTVGSFVFPESASISDSLELVQILIDYTI